MHYDLTLVLSHEDFPFFFRYCNSRVVKFSPDGKNVLLTITNEGRGRLILDVIHNVIYQTVILTTYRNTEKRAENASAEYF